MISASARRQVNQLLQKRPRITDMIDLPLWYKGSICYAPDNRKKAKREEPPEYFSLENANFLAACFRERKYIDDVFNCGFEIEKINGKMISRQVHACEEIGLTLSYLGYNAEGIKYLEKAFELVPEDKGNPVIKKSKIFSTWILCSKLNDKENWDKRLEYIKVVEDKFGKSEVDKSGMSMDVFLAKTYIDKKMFEEAEDVLKSFTDGDLKYGRFMWAELYFAQGDFKASADAFEKYPLPTGYFFWRSQYDYRKALAYYYSDQHEKCFRQAMKIRRRKKWDRFYGLEELESAGITREKYVDEIINSDSPDKFYLDTEKISSYIRVASYVIRGFYSRWKYPAAITIMIIIFLLLHCRTG